MLSLQNSNKFNKELSFYKKQTANIHNSKVKKHYEDLLKDFEENSKYIDLAHNSNASGIINPISVRENVENLYIIRRQLQKIIKDLNNT